MNASGYIFAGSSQGAFSSTDNGASWILIGLTNTSVLSLAVHPSGDIFAATLFGVYRTTDLGASWLFSGLSGSFVFALAVNSSGQIFAGTGNEGMFRSTDGGVSWAHLGLANRDIRSFAFHPDGAIFVGTFGWGVFRSTDNGVSWEETNVGLSPRFVSALTAAPNGHIFAGTSGGIFRSTSNGSSWSSIGLENIYVSALSLHSNGRLFAGTSGNGVFRSVNIPTSVEELPGPIPKAYALFQNYPNPFNPATTLRYHLLHRGRVTLEIYNIVGQKVKTLLDEEQAAGAHTVTWDGRDEKGRALPSGVYFYRLRTKEFTETKRMVFLK